MQKSTFYDAPTQLIVATLNEEEGIGPTLIEFKNSMRNLPILVVDGKSSDRTVEVAKDLGAEIAFQDGLGKGDALNKGISQLDSKTKYVILTDADYTYPAQYVPQMIDILEQNPKVGMVSGNRFSGEAEEKSFRPQFYLGNKMLVFAHNLWLGGGLEDPLTGLRVIRANILKSWKMKSKGFDVEVELNSQVLKQGYSITEVPIKYRVRLGEKKLKMRDGTTILKRILLEGSDNFL